MTNAIGRYDSWVDVGAAAIMGAAVGYCLILAIPGLGLAASAAGGLAAAGLTWLAMRQVGPKRFVPLVEVEALAPLPVSDNLPAKDMVSDELLLEEEAPFIPEEGEALLLDDILSEMAPSARVVRLFAPEPVPTAGELKERIDRHLADPERPSLAGPPEIAEIPEASDRLAAALNRVRQQL